MYPDCYRPSDITTSLYPDTYRPDNMDTTFRVILYHPTDRRDPRHWAIHVTSPTHRSTIRK